MRQIDLEEHRRSDPVRLSVVERDALSRASLSVSIEPAPGSSDMYVLTPGSVVGAADLGDLSVVIRPKLEISRVVFLASYAMDAFDLRDESFSFERAPTLVEALALALASAARRAFSRGLLHGYRTEHEALATVRGRIDMAEQMRRRFEAVLPVEVCYDDFTDDIVANRLIKAASELLASMRLHDARSRDGLRWIAATLANVTPVRFSPRDVPKVAFDRLNGHYREVVALSRLILAHQTMELRRGETRASGLFIDMNRVFQDFVTRALRESLGVSERTLRSDKSGLAQVTLDEGETIRLAPDLTWWDGSKCTFVGDAKYKRVDDRSAPNSDLYQILAYATALNLPGGLLIYAKGEADPAWHQVRYCGKRLGVATVDLSGSIDEIRASVNRLAELVRSLHPSRAGTRAA